MLGLSLCGGGVRCAAQVGALRVLQGAGYEFDVVSGVSMGAVVAACYAMGKDLERLAKEWAALRQQDVLGRGPLFAFSRRAALRFRAWLDRLCEGQQIQELPRKLLVLATDLAGGRPVIFEQGDLAEALFASCALPGVFPPVRRGDNLFVDGAVTHPLPPARLLQEHGATRSLAIYFPRRLQPLRPGFLNLIRHCGDILVHRLAEESLAHFDGVLEIDVSQHGLVDHRAIGHCLAAGEQAAKAALPQLLLDNGAPLPLEPRQYRAGH